MSQHDFEANGVRLRIGWDAPLATFFLQVWTGEEVDEDAGPSTWLGTTYGESLSPAPLLVIARRHVPDLPSTFHRQLTIDQLAAPARPRRRGLNDPAK